MLTYHDGQEAEVFDEIQAGYYGTCGLDAIEGFDAPVATIRNVQTGEVWEVDDLRDFDLLARNGG